MGFGTRVLHGFYMDLTGISPTLPVESVEHRFPKRRRGSCQVDAPGAHAGTLCGELLLAIVETAPVINRPLGLTNPCQMDAETVPCSETAEVF